VSTSKLHGFAVQEIFLAKQETSNTILGKVANGSVQIKPCNPNLQVLGY